MISLDTNVLVRYLVQDDVAQAKIASDLIEGLTIESPAFIAEVVVVELTWVLTARYKYSDAEVCALLRQLLATEQFEIENAPALLAAVAIYQAGKKAQFADALIVVKSEIWAAEPVYTFDISAQSVGMTLSAAK